MKLKLVQKLINDSYRQDGKISLLVIDNNGYQWHSRNHIPLDSSSDRANIIR
jgi:hypothetical protein